MKINPIKRGVDLVNIADMREIKIIILAFFAFLAVVPGAVAGTQTKGKAEFAEKSYNFGVIKGGNNPVSHEFEFVNTGNGNLVILDAKADCGCTKPEYPKAPLPPGKKGRIKVTFNPAGFMGAFEKDVTVRTNGNPRKIKLKVKGTVRK